MLIFEIYKNWPGLESHSAADNHTLLLSCIIGRHDERRLIHLCTNLTDPLKYSKTTPVNSIFYPKSDTNNNVDSSKVPILEPLILRIQCLHVTNINLQRSRARGFNGDDIRVCRVRVLLIRRFNERKVQ